ncbi:MAG: hypothetical protein SPE47_03160 [Roseburia faecis]|nr:hypothetical protein [Roseburia faecis]
MQIAVAILIVAAVDVVLDYITYRTWKKNLEEREKTVATIKRLYASALILIKQQTQEAEHLLNGQKMRHFAMNKQVLDIQDTLKEVKRVAGDIKRRNKKSGRQQEK